jgi:hypothetical protein
VKLLIRDGIPAPWLWLSSVNNKLEKIVITGTKEPSKHVEVHAKGIVVRPKMSVIADGWFPCRL